VRRQDLVDVLGGDPNRLGAQVMLPVERVTADGSDAPAVAIQHETAPVSLHEKEARIRLAVVLDAELDKCPAGDRYPLEQPCDLAVFVPLRVDPEPRVGKVLHMGLKARLDVAQRLLDALQPSLERRN